MINTVRRRYALAAVGLVCLLPACGGDDPTTSIEVTASFSLCREGNCHSLPAAGADVTFRDGNGRQVLTDTLDDAGQLKRSMNPGTYVVEVALPDLGLRVDNEDAPIVLTDGMGFFASLYFPDDLTVAESKS